MITANCNHLPSIQKLYVQERALELNSSRTSLADLEELIRKERALSDRLNSLVHKEIYCNSINWGFSSNYNWRR